MFGLLLFPNVFWALCLNGLTLGANIAIGTTYGNIVTAPPYNWSQDSASYVNIGQIVVAIIALPILGHGSDRIVKWKAQRNGGIHEPENRIIPLAFPLIVGVFSCVLYGLAAQKPTHYHWFTCKHLTSVNKTCRKSPNDVLMFRTYIGGYMSAALDLITPCPASLC